ncbi:alpha/beta hydrolase family protein [Roseateles chitinivorans]|uniref:alpha/beta hydrolase family protein n=1 Tax=Roseateles chitinivorans TaxID=2917965 RepID=UPI003D66D4B2
MNFLPHDPARRALLKRASVLTAANTVGAAFGAAAAFPARAQGAPASAPGASAADAVPAPMPGVQQGAWRDQSRLRDIPWRLRLPEGDRPVALVVFSHGLGGSLDGGTEWAQAWADAGIATLHLQHAGSDRAIWRSGLQGVKAAASAEQLIERGHDVQFAVEQLLKLQKEGNGAWARVRPEALGMSGHSFGAQTTLAVAGRDFRERSAPDLTESHFKAFAAFSPSAGHFPGGIKGITRPMLCLTGSLDGNPIGQERDGRYRRAVYDTLPAGAKAQLWLEGADHMSFGGGGERGAGFGQRLLGRAREPVPEKLAAHHAALIKSISTDWWRWRLLEDEAALTRLKAPKGLDPKDEWLQG